MRLAKASGESAYARAGGGSFVYACLSERRRPRAPPTVSPKAGAEELVAPGAFSRGVV